MAFSLISKTRFWLTVGCFFFYEYLLSVSDSGSFHVIIFFLFSSILKLFKLLMLQKIIHFGDITSVKRAKTAGIFPNAIEILAGGKKVV